MNVLSGMARLEPLGIAFLKVDEAGNNPMQS